jgi:HK97 family phage portal protein
VIEALRRRVANAIMPKTKALSPVDNRGGWWPVIRESFPGAFQHNFEVTLEDGLQYWAVFRCISIISSDIAKMRLRLVEKDSRGIWKETASPAFSPVIRKPNGFQNRIQFVESWMVSKLTRGNTYVLKQRDQRGVVTALYVLDPGRTKPMVADNGEVFYQLMRDNVAAVTADRVLVPASEIIHDRWNTYYHPLVGLSPLYACGINAYAALRIQQNSARLFANGAKPSGILTAPGAISDATAARLKAYWEENFTGENAGRVAVLGDDLKYQTMTMTAVDAQLIEQLKWNDATIAGCFGVPAYMINAGTAPAYNNVEALTQQYYSQCLQAHIEALELALDEGLGLTAVTERTLGTEFDTKDLLRMDTATKIKSAVEGLKGIYAPNEARAEFDLPPVPGGDSVYLQQQNYSIEALSKRDSKDDPFATTTPTPTPAPADGDGDGAQDDPDADAAAEERALEIFRYADEARAAV